MDNVRKIVRETLREGFSLINERLMGVDDDVDYIYDIFFREDVEILNKTGIITSFMFNENKTTTGNLKSPLSKKTHAINPCEIEINSGNNFYSPLQSLMNIGINGNAMSFVMSLGGSLDSASAELFSSGQITPSRNIRHEFSESKIKGSIHHELAHWIDDTLHNQHIKMRSIKASEPGVGMARRGLPINADKLEIQGQIHNVAQLKKEYKEDWDSLSFEDLVELSPTLYAIDNQLVGDIKRGWKRDLLKRMHREGLLGKNMIN